MKYQTKYIFSVIILLILFVTYTKGSTSNIQEHELQKKNNCAIVTLIYESHLKDDGFILGAQNLGYSLLLSKTTHNMVALVTEQVSEDDKTRLGRAGWNIKTIKAIKNHHQNYNPKYDYIFSKLQIFSLAEYDRVVYLDADMLVTENIDELCTCRGKYCAVMENTFFNAGMMVVEPNEVLFYDLIKKTTELHSYTSDDQGFLNNYFWDTRRCPFYDPREDNAMAVSNAECHRLPEVYNGGVSSFIVQKNKWNFDPNEEVTEPYIIHFMFSIFKPWRWWSYPIVTESWTWWGILTRSNAHASQVGIFTSLLVLVPMILTWSLLAICEFKPKMFHPSHTRRVGSLYTMSSFLKTGIMHLINVNCLAIAFAASNLPAIHPYANAIVFFISYCTLFEVFCIHMFNFLFKEPVPEYTSSALIEEKYVKPVYPLSLPTHRIIVYISMSVLLYILMAVEGAFFEKIFVIFVWAILVPTTELTYFVVKNYSKREYNTQ